LKISIEPQYCFLYYASIDKRAGNIMQKRMPCTGKCWVAIKDDRVVDLTPMYAPADVDFDAHRNACVAELEKSGTVRAGDLIRRDGQYFFVQRLTHQNRGVKPRTPKEYPIDLSSLRNK
jgi:hypothetical protein